MGQVACVHTGITWPMGYRFCCLFGRISVYIGSVIPAIDYIIGASRSARGKCIEACLTRLKQAAAIVAVHTLYLACLGKSPSQQQAIWSTVQADLSASVYMLAPLGVAR